ncbi:MAG: hypothetical protein J0M28_15665 [Thauera sp.]|nr:hypothetical protein [Thauera sp.]
MRDAIFLGGRVALVCAMLTLPVATSFAQRADELRFQMPELIGQVERVSMSPPSLVIDGRTYVAAPSIMLTREGVRDQVVSFAQIASDLVGKSVAYGWLGADAPAGGAAVNRIVVRGAPALAQPASGAAR